MNRFIDAKISFFSDFTSKARTVPFSDIMDAIKNGNFANQIKMVRYHRKNEKFYGELKKKLPHFTPSGVFKENRRKENLEEYSHLIVLDIDHIGEAVDEIKEKATKISHTMSAFISPGGEGLKIITLTDSEAENHEYAFNEIVSVYENYLGVSIDKSGKDISRACFVSYDPQIYYNTEATVFKITSQTDLPEFQETTVSSDPPIEKFEDIVDYSMKYGQFKTGNRNNFIHLLACNCNRFGLDEKVALSLIEMKYTDLPRNEIRQTVHSAYKNTDEKRIWKGSLTTLVATESYSAISKPKLVCPLHELIERSATEPKPVFLWHGVKEGSFGYVYGPPKSGKTIFCENLGMSIAAGLDTFLGYQIDQSRPRSVLFIGMEEFWRNRADRNHKQIMALDELDPSKFSYHVITENFPGRLSSKEDWNKLDEIINETRPDVVFVDSMTRTVAGEIETSSDSRDASFNLREMVRKYEITLIMIHHTTKLNGEKLDIDKLAGSRVIAQEADFIYGIDRKEQKRYFREVASRYKQEDDFCITFKIDDNLWIEKVIDLSDDNFKSNIDHREKPERDERIMTIIKELTQGEGSAKTVDILNEAQKFMGKSEFYRRIKNLDGGGKIRISNGLISLNIEQSGI